MRQFVLINQKGNRYSLNEKKSFMAEPSGLGFEFKVEYENYRGFFVERERELKQPKIKGTIYFDSYEEYYKFVSFIQFGPLELEYTSYETFHMKCNVDRVGKEELADFGKLKCPIEIAGKTSFYKKIIKRNDFGSNIGKTYPYTYPYSYAGVDVGTVEFDVESNMESGVKMTMMGPLINPSWSYFVNGTKKLSGKINAEIASGNRLVVDTTGSPYLIQEVDSLNQLVKDRYEDSDFSTKRFIRLEKGMNVISCTHEGTNIISMIAEAHVNYESV